GARCRRRPREWVARRRTLRRSGSCSAPVGVGSVGLRVHLEDMTRFRGLSGCSETPKQRVGGPVWMTGASFGGPGAGGVSWWPHERHLPACHAAASEKLSMAKWDGARWGERNGSPGLERTRVRAPRSCRDHPRGALCLPHWTLPARSFNFASLSRDRSEIGPGRRTDLLRHAGPAHLDVSWSRT